MENSQKIVIPLLSLLVVLVSVTLGVVLTGKSNQIDSQIIGESIPTTYFGPAKFNCESSDGTFANGQCTCPLYDEGSELTQDQAYDESTGFCQSPIGGPRGYYLELQNAESRANYLNKTIVPFNCEQSGGSFMDSVCYCPSELGEDLGYDEQTGYCTFSFGIPGGELGKTARALQEAKVSSVE